MKSASTPITQTERITSMLNEKPFAMFFNASPRKDWNTAKALASAAEGAQEAGAETEVVNLFDFDFTGCTGGETI